MAELVDALVSGTSGSNTLEVRVFLCPPYVEARWGCSSVDRALRSHRRGRGFESHQLHHPWHQWCFGWQEACFCRNVKTGKKSWGYGGMVDAEDLKSFDHCDRVGSSPTIPTTDFHQSETRAENRACLGRAKRRRMSRRSNTRNLETISLI